MRFSFLYLKVICKHKLNLRCNNQLNELFALFLTVKIMCTVLRVYYPSDTLQKWQGHSMCNSSVPSGTNGPAV